MRKDGIFVFKNYTFIFLPGKMYAKIIIIFSRSIIQIVDFGIGKPVQHISMYL